MSYTDAVKKITVQHLLEQTDGWDSSLPKNCSDVTSFNGQKDYIDCMLDDATNDTNFSSGTKWHISSFGYVLLGRIIEKLAKITDPTMTYERYVRENVLKACGATNLYIGRAKVIIHKSRSGISLVEQDTIEYVSWPIKIHYYIIKKKKYLFFPFILCNFLVQTLQYFFLK